MTPRLSARQGRLDRSPARINFDVGKDPLDAVPALPAVLEFLELAKLSIHRRGREFRFRAGSGSDEAPARRPKPIETFGNGTMNCRRIRATSIVQDMRDKQRRTMRVYRKYIPALRAQLVFQ